MAGPQAPHATRSGMVMHAVVRAFGQAIAIPSECVMRVVAAPPRLTPVPRRSGAIMGVMTLGRRVLPVIDLARWLQPAAGVDRADSDPAEHRQALVLLLKDGDACVGLAVESVVGAQRIRRDGIRRLFHDDSPDELFQSAALFGNDSEATCILEPGRLMALAGVWVDGVAALDAVGTDDGDVSVPAAGGDSRRVQGGHEVVHATFRIAGAHVALPAGSVGELMHRVPLRNELLARDGVLGLCEWRDRLVPVIDLAGALQVLPADDAAAWVCIVCADDLAVGIVMHEVLEITRIAPDAGTPETTPAAERSVVGRRLVDGGRTLQVIDVAALLRRYTETAISAADAQARGARARTTRDPSAPAYMVFDAGGMFAAAIDSVQEVVALPDDMRPQLDAGVATTLQWREQPVPVMAIADSLVALPAQAARQLVIIRQGERLAALTIASVKAMVPRGIARRNRMRLQGRPVEVISVDTEDHRASYPVVDLDAALRTAA